jgi:hypothetical protein
MPVRVGENEAVVAFAEGFGLGDELAAGFFNFGGPAVGLGFAFGGEGEYDLVGGMGIGKLTFHGGFQDVFFEEMDDQIFFAKKETDQVVGPAIELNAELGVKLGCAVQVGYGQVAPYFFWSHNYPTGSNKILFLCFNRQ